VVSGPSLAVRVGGGHALYLLAAAGRAQTYLMQHPAKSVALRALGDNTDQIMGHAIAQTSTLETDEEIREVVRILKERGVRA
jgi:hypothetical protein